MIQIQLTQQSLGYDGKPQRLEVSSFSKDIHDRAGIYLQHVEGCGYMVMEMTPDEALSLAAALTKAAQDTIREFDSAK